MLEFWKNGKKVEIKGIYNNGKVGQMIILGERIDWGKEIDNKQPPLSKYNYSSVFIIVERMREYYTIRDVKGNLIKVDFNSIESGYLYDLQEWVIWNNLYQEEKISQKQKKIEQLEGHKELLKEILIKQGIRIVTEAQAKELKI